ncbi:hypothetical protein GF373_13590, partial [bacterium]|nr:hypothetical protein [bacterium]
MMDLIPETIAVIGMGCHFPGGGNHPKLLWSLLEKGKDCISEIPHDRWDHKQFQYPNVRISQWGGFLQDRQPGECDAAFFDLSPGEATALDPQQRWLLEVSWEALEYGGIDPRQLTNQNVGIFTGISTQDYAVGSLASTDLNTLSHYTGTGSSFSTSAGRLSYFYGTRGPAFSIDTACSSSLTAFHQARQSLRIGECDMAIVGGVNAMLTPHLHVYLSKLGVMAGDGRCKTFDRRADGYVRSEGCGVLILKRFKDACRDGNTILAHCLGSAITQCGRGTSLTAPRVSAQE